MKNPHPAVPPSGPTFRFVVTSAEEAVKMIQEKLGPAAQVISVKQLTGSGFAGLLGAPKLEVIAQVIAPPPPLPAEASAPLPPPSFSEISAAVATPFRPEEPLERILLRAGLSKSFLLRLSNQPRWRKITERPLRESLAEVVALLRVQWNERLAYPVGQRIVFFGTPGSGTTTALCKALTIETFFRQQKTVVLKLDGDQPNPIEGLAMFCEALNVPLLRSADELDVVGERVYCDVAGVSSRDGSAWSDLGRLFGEFYIDTRVLVVNAAYETELIKHIFTRAREAGATHVVFTHLDELNHWGKLWEPLLESELCPLFFSCGQNISGDVSEDVFEMLVEKTFGLRK